MASKWQIGRRYDSIFEIVARAKNHAIFEHAARMDWADCFNALAGIREAEIKSLDRGIIEEDSRIVLANAETLAALSEPSKRDIAHKHATYRAWRIFHTGFLLTRNFMPEPEIEIESLAQVVEQMHITPLLLAPFHVGPSVESAVAILSRLAPLALVARAENLSRLRIGLAAVRPALDLELIPLGPLALVQCLQAVRNGRSVCVAPDMLVHPGVAPTMVTFFGARINVPSGTAALANALNLPLHPFVFRHSLQSYYYRLFDPVWFPADETGRLEAIQRLIEVLMTELERHNPWEWYGWRYLHDQLVLPDTLLEDRPA